MHLNKYIADMRCVMCGNTHLSIETCPITLFVCTACGESYKHALGVPFFGYFEPDDILGLIEIAANIDNRGRFGITPEVVEKWEKLLADYHASPQKADFERDVLEAQQPFFLNRYNEWLEIKRLAGDLDIKGKEVLDIGAGLGFDSYRLSMRGAHVTALEFSPLLAEWGKSQFPDIRWVGGFSHCLPFRNGSFDAVFCNAALHHMKDIPTSLSEALRVLRPGGFLITTCDSFRASKSDENAEIETFDQQGPVLMGVNERVPKFAEFVETFLLHPELLDVEIYTHLLCDPQTGTQCSEILRWTLSDDGDMLSRSGGSLAMRITLKALWPEKARCQKSTTLDPGDYASWLTDASSAVAKLSPLISEHYINSPLLGQQSTKFELLNGWRLRKPLQLFRTAYRRGRWFLRRSEAERILSFELALPFSNAVDEESIRILVDGMLCCDHQARRLSWTKVRLDISHIPLDKVFAVELRKEGRDETLDKACFLVRNRQLLPMEKMSCIDLVSSCPRVFAVIPVYNRLHFTRECINRLKSQTYPALTIIVADGGSTDGTVDSIRSEYPDVVVLASDKELWWTGSMAMGIEYALENSSGADDFILMMNNDTIIPDDYVATLVFSSQCHDAAVGAIVADSRDPKRILDAGEYIDWSKYYFWINNLISSEEYFRGDVDFLPGRGSLVPLRMIRAVGSVDTAQFPHYLADYDFFYRLKRKGFLLGICSETQVLAHIDETGLLGEKGPAGFYAIGQELFSRRSMHNVVDHWHFIARHSPDQFRVCCYKLLIFSIVKIIALRSPLRYLFGPIVKVFGVSKKIADLFQGQRRSFAIFVLAIRKKGIDVLCYPQSIPAFLRLPLFLLVCPGPITQKEFLRCGLDAKDLLSQNIVRKLSAEGWYGLETLEYSGYDNPSKLKQLFWLSWNPIRKIFNTCMWRRDMRKNTAVSL